MICRPPFPPNILSVLVQKPLQRNLSHWYPHRQGSMPPPSSPTQEIRHLRPSLQRRGHLVRAAAPPPPGLHKIQVPHHCIKPLRHHPLFLNTTRSTIVPIYFTCRYLHPRFGGERASFVPLQPPTKAYPQTHPLHPRRRILLFRVSSLLRFQRSNVQKNGNTVSLWASPPARSYSPVGDR